MLERRNEGREELVCIIAYKRASFVISGGLSIINPIRACFRPSGQGGGGGGWGGGGGGAPKAPLSNSENIKATVMKL